MFLIMFYVIPHWYLLLVDANYTNYILWENERKALLFIQTILF